MKSVVFALLSLAPLFCRQLAVAFKSTNFYSAGSARRQDRSPIIIRRESACVVRFASEDDSPSSIVTDDVEKRFTAASTDKSEIIVASGESLTENASSSKAATSTINERLMSELQAAVEKEKYGSKKKREYFKEFRSRKTEEERRRSIEEAKDLNGVNPLVCIGGAAFAWSCAGVLWLFTTYLGVVFASHPLETDIYFIQRLTSVFRNVVMGLTSLASGFFGKFEFELK